MLSLKINNVCIPRIPNINQCVSFLQCFYYAMKVLWHLDDIYVRKCRVILLNLLFVICYGCFQIFELFHPFSGTIISLYIETSSWILILRHDHVLSFIHITATANNNNNKPSRTGFLVSVIVRNTLWRAWNITNGTCRRCWEKSETVPYISGTCYVLAQGNCTHCHNQVANMIHQELAIKCGLSKGKQHCIIEMNYKLY